jgi:hypothetical protein
MIKHISHSKKKVKKKKETCPNLSRACMEKERRESDS